jgi:RNA polymerase-interacting CarD/CdnL/TRCF family regulator
MTNGGERLDRIEHILEQVAGSQENLAKSQEGLVKLQKESADSLAQVNESLARVSKRLEEMAARQQYHDEAFERFDAEMKVIKEAIAVDAENIRAVLRRAGGERI